eukprot:3089057-Rhodomonas_salina.1
MAGSDKASWPELRMCVCVCGMLARVLGRVLELAPDHEDARLGLKYQTLRYHVLSAKHYYAMSIT